VTQHSSTQFSLAEAARRIIERAEARAERDEDLFDQVQPGDYVEFDEREHRKRSLCFVLAKYPTQRQLYVQVSDTLGCEKRYVRAEQLLGFFGVGSTRPKLRSRLREARLRRRCTSTGGGKASPPSISTGRFA